jgi:hypothetical protein
MLGSPHLGRPNAGRARSLACKVGGCEGAYMSDLDSINAADPLAAGTHGSLHCASTVAAVLPADRVLTAFRCCGRVTRRVRQYPD